MHRASPNIPRPGPYLFAGRALAAALRGCRVGTVASVRADEVVQGYLEIAADLDRLLPGLLDVHGAMQRHAALLPPDWERISAEWRTKQLEYTWVDTLTGHHRRDFWQVTQDALAFVAARHRITEPAVR